MPYIEKQHRQPISNNVYGLVSQINGPGELNFAITKLIQEYLTGEKSYAKYNEIIGVLECCKLEYYRRQIAEYENEKKNLNGDVY